MVVAFHLGGRRLGMECGRRWTGGILQSEIGKSKPESPDKRACKNARVKFPTWAAAWRREPRRPAERLSLYLSAFVFNQASQAVAYSL